MLARTGEVLQQVAELGGLGDAQVDAQRPSGCEPVRPPYRRRTRSRSQAARRGPWRASPVCALPRSGRCPSRCRPCAGPTRRSCTSVPSPPCSVSPSVSASPKASAFGSSRRGALCASGFSSLRSRTRAPPPRTWAPSPSRRAACPPSAASPRLSNESTPSVECSSRTRFGPTPGKRVIATKPGGILARSFSIAGIVPVSINARIFSCNVAAYARELSCLPFARQDGHRDRRLAHRSRAAAIGQHPVHDRPVQLVQVAQFLQGLGDRGIGGLTSHALVLSLRDSGDAVAPVSFQLTRIATTVCGASIRRARWACTSSEPPRSIELDVEIVSVRNRPAPPPTAIENGVGFAEKELAIRLACPPTEIFAARMSGFWDAELTRLRTGTQWCRNSRASPERARGHFAVRFERERVIARARGVEAHLGPSREHRRQDIARRPHARHRLIRDARAGLRRSRCCSPR